MYSLCSLRSHIAPNSHVSYPVILADVRYVYRDSSELTQEDFCAFLMRYSFDNVRTRFTEHTRQRQHECELYVLKHFGIISIRRSHLLGWFLALNQSTASWCLLSIFLATVCMCQGIFHITIPYPWGRSSTTTKYIHIHNTHFFICLCTVQHLRVSHSISSRFSLVDYQYSRFVVGIFHRCGHISIMLLAFSHFLPLLLFFFNCNLFLWLIKWISTYLLQTHTHTHTFTGEKRNSKRRKNSKK